MTKRDLHQIDILLQYFFADENSSKFHRHPFIQSNKTFYNELVLMKEHQYKVIFNLDSNLSVGRTRVLVYSWTAIYSRYLFALQNTRNQFTTIVMNYFILLIPFLIVFLSSFILAIYLFCSKTNTNNAHFTLNSCHFSIFILLSLYDYAYFLLYESFNPIQL